jgi:hypothetical protein
MPQVAIESLPLDATIHPHVVSHPFVGKLTLGNPPPWDPSSSRTNAPTTQPAIFCEITQG